MAAFMTREEFRQKEALFFIQADDQTIVEYDLQCDLMVRNKVSPEEQMQTRLAWFDKVKKPSE